jgi:hypothetical protein
MNWQSVKNISWFYPKTVTAINLFCIDDSTYRGEVVVLKLQKKQIVTVKQIIIIGNLNEILQQLPEKSAICLTLDGKGILFKDWDDDGASKKHIFKELLPQGNFNEFYSQKHSLLEKNYVGIARKNYIDDILNEFKKDGFVIIDLVFGPFILSNTRSFITEQEDVWNIPNRKIIWETQTIATISLSKEQPTSYYTFGNELVSAEYLVAFSHAFWALVAPQKLHNDVEDVLINRTNLFYKKAIGLVGTAILAFYFVLLILNYQFFTSFSLQLNETLIEYESSLKTINKLELYKAELQQKELLAQKIGLGTHQQLSYVADRIASTLPDYISLTRLDINPIDGQRQRKNTPEFIKGKILISGTINNGVRLYHWIEKVKKLSFIQQAEVVELIQDEPLIPAIFTIELQYSSIKD